MKSSMVMSSARSSSLEAGCDVAAAFMRMSPIPSFMSGREAPSTHFTSLTEMSPITARRLSSAGSNPSDSIVCIALATIAGVIKAVGLL